MEKNTMQPAKKREPLEIRLGLKEVLTGLSAAVAGTSIRSTAAIRTATATVRGTAAIMSASAWCCPSSPLVSHSLSREQKQTLSLREGGEVVNEVGRLCGVGKRGRAANGARQAHG